MAPPTSEQPTWGFLTNHTHVLLAIRRDSAIRQRDIAAMVGITEGAVQRIVSELEHGGYLRRHKVGRRNEYEIVDLADLRHQMEDHHTLGELLDVLES